MKLLSEANNMSKFSRILKRKKVESLLSYDQIFFPVNIEKLHWFLIVVDTSLCKIQFYDSIP